MQYQQMGRCPASSTRTKKNPGKCSVPPYTCACAHATSQVQERVDVLGLGHWHHLVSGALGMGHDLDDRSVACRGLGKLMCRTTWRTRQQSARCCRRNRGQRHEASLSAWTARPLTDRWGVCLQGLPHRVPCGLGGTTWPTGFAGHPQLRQRTRRRAAKGPGGLTHPDLS